MKKILLALASLFVVASYASAQTEDSSTDASTGTTIYEYDFNKFPSGPVAYEYYGKVTMNTSIIELTTSDIKTDENSKSWITIENYSDDYGLIAESTNDSEAKSNYRYGLSVVDLGEAGKALCLNGVSSGLSNYLEINLPALPTCNPYQGLSFSFGNKTESLAGKKLRLEVTYAIYQASEASASRLNNFIVRTKTGNQVSIVSGDGTTTYDKLGFGAIVDPEVSYKANAGKLEKWVTVTHDFEVASSGYVGGPFFLEMQVKNGGTINDKSLLIKSVKLSEIDAIDSNNASGNVTTSDFGTVKAVAATAWNPTITDGVLAYPHAYCNESAEYAMKRVSGATDAELLAAVKAANNSFVDADFEAVADGDYFTKNDDGNWTVDASAVKKYVNKVAAADDAEALEEVAAVGDAEALEEVVLAVRVKAGANKVVVGTSYFGYAVNSNDSTPTGVTDVTIADDEAPVYYNLSGLRIAKPTAPGLYIRRQGAKATKVVIK
jgi:hypothetical protein